MTRRTITYAILAAFCTALPLTTCTVGPNFTPPTPPSVSGYTSTPPSLSGAGASDAQQSLAMGKDVRGEWWTLFLSPDLDQVLALAISDNPSLDQARATLAAAQEEIAVAAGASYPQLDLSAAATRQRQAAGGGRQATASTVSNLFSIGPTVSFDLDIFGKNRRLVEEETALAEVQRAQLGAAYLSLTGNAVTQAITIASVREQIAASEQIIKIDRNNLDLVHQAAAAGRSAQLDVLTAESQLANDQVALPPLNQQLDAARHALAILAGKTPAEWTPPDFEFGNLRLPEELPVTLPSALARRRPDILAAEAQLHAASADIGVATAEMYPDFSLSASWTQQALSIGDIAQQANGLWSLGAGIAAPLFHGGALAAQRRAAIDTFDAQLASYRQVVLQAFGQVADVLQALQHDAELLDAQDDALRVAGATLDLTQQSYSSGQASFLQVLEAQRLYQQARLGYAKAKGQRYQDTAQLFEVMGGAWGNVVSQ